METAEHDWRFPMWPDDTELTRGLGELAPRPAANGGRAAAGRPAPPRRTER